MEPSSNRRARYREAIALAPHLPTPYLQLAGLLRERGDSAAAVEVLEEALRHLGDEPAVLHQLVAAGLEADDSARAVRYAERLVARSPSDARAKALLAEARTRHERASVPADFFELSERPQVLRKELAALLVLRMPAVARMQLPDRFPIVIDIDESWAEPHIRRVTATRLMEVFPNHAFEPDMPVARGMLTDTVYRVLRATGVPDPPASHTRTIRDLPSRHPLRRAAQAATALGIVRLDPSGNLRMLETVSGREALTVIERLAEVVEQRTTLPEAGREIPSRRRR